MWENIDKLKQNKNVVVELTIAKKEKKITCLYAKPKQKRARFNKGEKVKKAQFKTGKFVIDFN